MPDQATNNFVKLLTALCAPIQDAENALMQLLQNRSLGTAVGAQLDVLGAIVGQPRQGLSDDDYTRYIRARIATDRSNGLINELINIVSLILNDNTATITLTEQNFATVVVQIGVIEIAETLADILIEFLLDAVSAGVRPILITSDMTPGTTFKWDTAGRGWDVAPFMTARDHVLGI